MDYKPPEIEANKGQLLLLCQQINGYRGLERSLPFANKLISANVIMDILGMADNDGDIPYSFENFGKLQAIRERLVVKGLALDIILIGQPPMDNSHYKSVNFLGFDISGESLFHSWIYRYYFDALDVASNRNDEFYGKLNQNGLFSNAATASQFIEHMSAYSYHFENEKGISPVEIWELVV